MHLKMLSVKWWPFCPGANELKLDMLSMNLLWMSGMLYRWFNAKQFLLILQYNNSHHMNKESLMTILSLKGNPYTWNDSMYWKRPQKCVAQGPVLVPAFLWGMPTLPGFICTATFSICPHLQYCMVGYSKLACQVHNRAVYLKSCMYTCLHSIHYGWIDWPDTQTDVYYM